MSLNIDVKCLACIASTALLFTSQNASACACCAERGYSSSHPIEFNIYPDEILREIAFGRGEIHDPGYEIGWSVSGIVRFGEEYVIHTEVGELQFKPRRPYQLRATDISFITHPDPEMTPMGNVRRSDIAAAGTRERLC